MARNFSKRDRPFRQTNRQIVIAMTGAKTEPIYFAQFRPARDAGVSLVRLPALNNKSSPHDVLRRVKGWMRDHTLAAEDQVWLVIDRDEFPVADIDDVCQQAGQRGWHVALSNPCFELWLWLHLRDNRPFVDRHQCQREFEKLFPGYEKGGYDAAALLRTAHDAVRRASQLDTQPQTAWPRTQATRVYPLVRQLLSCAPPGNP